MSKINDLTNRKFGRWTALERTSDMRYWKCVCECGNTGIIFGSSLTTGSSRSCGCFKIERTKETNTKHGLSKSVEFATWSRMKARCSNENIDKYKSYGGRGIRVCDRWMEFENFYKDMGKRPEGKTLDRIDVNGDYCPENCRWSTWYEQDYNKRDTVRLTYNGMTKTLPEWSEITGINTKNLMNRIVRKWTVERTLTQKPRRT